MPVAFGRTLTQFKLTQSGAGATDIAAAPGAGLKIYVVTIVLTVDADGTVKFTEGTGPTDLTGTMPVLAAQSPYVIKGTSNDPVLSTNTANTKLSIVTGTSKAFGWVTYFIDS